MFENTENEKQKKIDAVVDKIKEKYGYETITRAGKMNVDKNIKLKEDKKWNLWVYHKKLRKN